MKKTTNYLSLILALTLLAGCGSSGQAAAPEESTAANTSEAVEETANETASENTEAAEETTALEIPEEPEMPDEEEEPVYDFDPDTNVLVEFGDFTIEMPESWYEENTMMYSPDRDDAIRWLDFKYIWLDEPLTEGELFSIEGDYFIEQDLWGYPEYEIVERKLVSYNGIKMLYKKAHIVLDTASQSRYYYLFLNPSDSTTLSIKFQENDDKQISLVGDLKAMLNTLKLKEE